jgi:CheY-like chemotaxis protein
MELPVKNILLAEDKDDEYVLFVQAVNGLSNSINVMRQHHGYNLLSMLQTDIHADAIFLDINMPYKNGLLILQEIRQMERFFNIPVIILSNSTYELNVKQAYQLKATFFAAKTEEVKQLQSTLKFIFNSTYYQSRTQPPWTQFFIQPS